MEYLNLAPLDREGGDQYVITAVPSQQYSVQLGQPVQNSHLPRLPQNRSEGWSAQKNIKLLPKPAPSHGPKILCYNVIRPADETPCPVLVNGNGNQFINNNHNVCGQVRTANVGPSSPQNLLKPNQIISKPNIIKKKQAEARGNVVPGQPRIISTFGNSPIHILKSGDTYKSLENLDEEKLKLVTSALKTIGNPMKSKKRTVYDGATKTRIKYKVVYPKDLNISGTSEITINSHAPERESETNISTSQPTLQTAEEQTNSEQNNTRKAIVNEAPPKVTRSGREVKLPKGRGPQDDQRTTKTRKQKFVNQMTCLRCHAKFSGIAKINRHYEQFPTHKPNTTHSNLFKCFLDIMRRTPLEEKGYAFVEQLEELILKIRRMLPCMINNIDQLDCNEGKLCCINEDLGKMLDMEPGKYNISVDEAVHCHENGKDKCKHTVRGNTLGSSSDLSKPSQLWVAKHNEEIAMMSSEETDCARTHSVDKWPVIKKRIKKYVPVASIQDAACQNVPSTEQSVNNSTDAQLTNIWIVPKDTNTISLGSNKLIRVPETIHPPVLNVDAEQVSTDNFKTNILQGNDRAEPKPAQNYQYLSSHFDIHTSPIKSPTAAFNKILIKNDNFSSFVKLTEDETHPKSDPKSGSHMQIDINGIFSGLGRAPSKLIEEPKPVQTRPNQFYRTPQTDLTPMGLSTLQAEIPKEYAMPSGANSNFCNITQGSRCQNDRLLSSGNTQVPQSEALAGLCANETNLDNSRMLLDHLGNDCLSFTDTELRNASLDLPLDLFPFNNAE